MKILGIIPARFASTRFPGKPLIDIGGKSMIRRVYDQAVKCKSLSKVVVATDDQRIYDHVITFGGLALMTSSDHQSGTDRAAEVASSFPEYEIFINIQGDEPFIDPTQIDLLCNCFLNNETHLATLIKVITDSAELFNPNIPKVIVNKNQEAIYFSRGPIPVLRNFAQENWVRHHTYYKHIGIYGYRNKALTEITCLPVSKLENAESLEQLRWIENSYPIKTAITDLESISIDTPQDLEHALSVIDLPKF